LTSSVGLPASPRPVCKGLCFSEIILTHLSFYGDRFADRFSDDRPGHADFSLAIFGYLAKMPNIC
jgi:hypothetical protein